MTKINKSSIIILIMFILVGTIAFRYSSIKNYVLENNLDATKRQNKIFFNRMELEKYFILKDVTILKVDKTDRDIISQSHNSIIIYVKDSLACFSCLQYHLDLIAHQESNWPVFLLNSKYGTFAKTYVPNIIIINSELSINLKKQFLNFDVIIFLINKEGKIWYILPHKKGEYYRGEVLLSIINNEKKLLVPAKF